MPSHGRRPALADQVRSTAEQLLQEDPAAVRSLLPAEQVQRAVEAEAVNFRQCLFTPLVTLWAFLAQVLSPDHSCRQAVASLLTMLCSPLQGTEHQEQELEADTGPYCKARKRLPERLLATLAKDAGQSLHRRYPAGRLLAGRRVKVVDGTTCSMPDTPQNQKQYPQPAPQKPGLGFPMIRLVAVLSLHCAAVLAVAMGPYSGQESGEPALFRRLIDELEPWDVVLADRYYASYWMISLLLGRNVDSLFRQHQARKGDFRKGRRLGKNDHLLTWNKPTKRPEWMDQATHQRMPAQLTVREVRVRVDVPGFRVRSLLLVTTLLDAQKYSLQELAQSFRCRWCVELDLRAIKHTMHMSVLRCQTPEMVRKEIWMHLLGYNLVRGVMAQAANEQGLEPRDISFAGAVQTINAFIPVLQWAEEQDLPRLWQIMLRAIARHRVRNRPDRYEPRAVKRRAKPIAFLTVPREQARRRLARCVSAKP